MKYIDREETIVALSTPPGRGAIAVIRVSGANSLSIINQLASRPLSAEDHRRAVRTEISTRDRSKIIDDCVFTYFRSPNSYTGEDVVEISCHCNSLIIDQIIQEVVSCGGRLAEPGEFTRRAYLNGKMDLSQAEAVAAVIESRTRQGLTYSMRQLEGGLSDRIRNIQKQIIDLLSLMEVSLDFNEEDIQVYDHDEVAEKSESIRQQIEQLLHTYEYGRLIRDGVKLLLLGKPNVGKSSLLNALLQKERAIVSELPGTTRDYIEEYTQIEGFPVQIVDTAGIRETLDRIEEIGVNRALRHIESADLVLALFEAHRSLDADDLRLIDHLLTDMNHHVHLILVLNKSDLGKDGHLPEQLKRLNAETVYISARTGEHLDLLREKIESILTGGGAGEQEDIVITSLRHKDALSRATENLEHFIAGIKNRFEEVILAADLRNALNSTGEIVGEVTSEDLLNHIFGQFCIGK